MKAKILALSTELERLGKYPYNNGENRGCKHAHYYSLLGTAAELIAFNGMRIEFCEMPGFSAWMVTPGGEIIALVCADSYFDAIIFALKLIK